ncbi:hypothetical protein [Streptomyces sp. NPDC000229]|uniref:hypothetical protein n=1 Tax=Streptomyces sp. NPDC000229 TaxID=3154247 RepID=UPI0033275104
MSGRLLRPWQVQCAVERALLFLSRSMDGGGAPSAGLALDPCFRRGVAVVQARAVLRERFGADPGFDLGDEAFTAMVALMLLPPAAASDGWELVPRLARQIESARWQRRYRFFPGGNGFSADTDCTGLAVGALYEHGLLSSADLEAHIVDLLRSAPLPGSVWGQDGRGHDGGACRSRGLMVYWEDGLEPGTLPRGRKHDAVACANALYTLQLNGSPLTVDGLAVVEATTRYLADMRNPAGI